MDKKYTALVVAAIGIALVFAVRDYQSPYNQCVRAETNLREARGVMDGAKDLARVYCAEALGGKPD